MTLTQYSKKHGLCRKTAWNHFKRGLISGAYQLPSGKVVIPEEKSSNAEIVNLLQEAIRRLEK